MAERRQAPSGRTQLVTLQTASVEYGPPVQSLRDLIARGALPVVQFAGRRRIWIDRRDLEKLIESSRGVRQ